jgi:D-serine dehydratase
MAELTGNTKKLETFSVKDFTVSQDITQVVKKIRKNANGYPYVTFVDTQNVAQNIYFSKRAAAKLDESAEVDMAFLSQYVIAMATNEEGEERVKLATGDSLRTDLTW